MKKGLIVYLVDSDDLGARTDEALREILEENDELEYADVWWGS